LCNGATLYWHAAAAQAGGRPAWSKVRAIADGPLIGITIAFLALLQIAAALYHHFVRKDAVLMCMLRG
jgi:cytochrome b561